MNLIERMESEILELTSAERMEHLQKISYFIQCVSQMKKVEDTTKIEMKKLSLLESDGSTAETIDIINKLRQIEFDILRSDKAKPDDAAAASPQASAESDRSDII